MAAIYGSGGRPVSPVWPFLYCVGLGVAFIYYWPAVLALVSRAAPPKVNATMMGIVFMSLFISHLLIGWRGGFYDRISPIWFWAAHALIGAAGGLLVMVFGRRLRHALADASGTDRKRAALAAVMSTPPAPQARRA